MSGSFLFSVFVFLAAACVLVPLSKRLGLGAVIGYLVAGILIGPFALRLITDSETILHFAEFGVVMMLFLIGLELQPRELWNMRGKLLGLGGAQVGLTLGAVAGIAALLGYGLSESLAISMALSLSSTAIALRIMEDRTMMLEPAGRAGFSVLLFQDVVVIAMIASTPWLATLGMPEPGTTALASVPGEDGAVFQLGLSGWQRVAAIIGVFAGMIAGGRLLRPAFRAVAVSDVREVFTAVALLVVIGAALLMQMLELSAALGAFIAGVVLADSEYRHQLEREIEPFKSLLLGLFFMSVGMNLDFNVLAAEPVFLIVCVFGLMALKFGILLLVGRFAGLRAGDNLLFAGLLAQAGEFGFVLFQFAQLEGVMSGETVSILSAVVALSMALTPLLLLAYDKALAPHLAPAPMTGDAPEDENNRVLILGYGRVGQIVDRLLSTQGIGATLIDNDGEHIEFVKQFGNRVFYGDAADMDLLRMAGAEHADVIAVAVDDIEAGNRASRNIQQAFPNAKIVARARGRNQLYELMAIGVDFAERETVRSSLAMGRKVLEFLGTDERRARRLSDLWLERDFEIIQRDYHLRDDLDALRERADQNRALMKATLHADMEAEDASQDGMEEHD